MEAFEAVKKLQAANPLKRFAIGNNGTRIGYWSDELNEYVQFASNQMIYDPGAWYDMPEVRVNGQRFPIDWMPVEAAQGKD